VKISVREWSRRWRAATTIGSSVANVSKKRRAKKAANAAVVDEVLAEGSGPHAIPDEEGVVAVRVALLEESEIAVSDPGAELVTEAVFAADADAQVGSDAHVDADALTASDTATTATPKRKTKRNKARHGAAADDAEAAAASGSETSEAEAGADAAAASDSDSDSVSDADAVAAADADVETAPDTDADAVAAAAIEGSEFDAVARDGEHAEPVSDGTTDESLHAAADGEQLDDLEAADGAILPTSAATMDAKQLKSLVEALVFASDKPVTVPRLRQLTRVADVKRLEQALTELAADYEHRGLILHQVSGGYQFRTRPQYSIWVQQLIAGRPVRLSRAQLETLAIVAYRQPITRPEIDDIRGVDSSATLKLLLDRMLIRVLGKKEEVGRPTLYGTTKEFLDFFSLGDLRELPTLREYSELSEESRKVMSERLGVDPDGGSSGGSTPPADGGGMDGGPMAGGGMEGGPSDGASMSAAADDGVTDDAGTASAVDAIDEATMSVASDDERVGSRPRSDTETELGDELGEATAASLDGEGLDGDTPHTFDGDALNDATAHLDDGLGGETAHETAQSLDDAGLDGDTPPSLDDDGMGGATAHSLDGEGLDGETVHSSDTEDEAAFGDGSIVERATDEIETAAEVDDELVEAADSLIAADVLAGTDVDNSTAEPQE